MSPRNQDPFSLEYLLLGMLEEKPMHAYDLHKSLLKDPNLSMVWNVKQSLVYALLGKLENFGLVDSTQVPDRRRPARYEYTMTTAGRKAFLDWLTSPVTEYRSLRQDFLVKVFFARKHGKATLKRLLRGQKTECRVWLDAVTAEPDEVDPSTSFMKTVSRFRKVQIDAVCLWLDEIEKEIDQ